MFFFGETTQFVGDFQGRTVNGNQRATETSTMNGVSIAMFDDRWVSI